ncbi:MAG: glycoside hydrolase family 97 catalytic domain-containing protein [Mangrovibacterium sp.]
MRTILLALLFAAASLGASAKELNRHSLTSPNGDYNYEVYQKSEDGVNQLYYTVSYKNRLIVGESKLGVLIKNQLFESALGIPNDTVQNWCDNLELMLAEKASVDTVWHPTYGEKSEIPNNFNELTLKFKKYGAISVDHSSTGHSGTSYNKRREYEMNFEVRAYNEGIAFRYDFPETSNGLFLHIEGEQTNFVMPENTMTYYERWAQGHFEFMPLNEWKDECERPLTMELDNGLFVCLTEAKVVDYPRTKFVLNSDTRNTIDTYVYNKVDVMTPSQTPWRVIMAAEEAGELLENNYLILNLNDENKIANTSWIKPGKVFRCDLTTEAGMTAVDFAADRGLQYIHFDAGWYGKEMLMASDASTIDPNRPLDLQAVINYAATKNIGVFVYVNQRALAEDYETLFPLYQSWGLKGVKFGFVQVGSSEWTSWMHKAIRKAAECQLLVDVHDEYRPTGYSRTYPNLMTQEGIAGNEEMPDATHNVTLPFTRFVAGAGDYTLCYFNSRIKTTHAHQLAMAVVYYSPLQYMYWYDKPHLFKGEKELDFWKVIPTVWDDTKVLNGEISKYITVARLSGDDWFVGTMTNNDARKLSYRLDFLAKDKNYIAYVYTDDAKMGTRTNVKSQSFAVKQGDVVNLNLEASGGAAIYIKSVESAKGYAKLPKQL